MTFWDWADKHPSGIENIVLVVCLGVAFIVWVLRR